MNARYKNLPPNQVLAIYPPNIHAQLTGVFSATQNNTGDVRLSYADGSSETARFDRDMDEIGDWFALVSAVQTKARAAVA